MGANFKCPNVLLRKCLEVPTPIPRHAHKYKLFMICPTALGTHGCRGRKPITTAVPEAGPVEGTRAVGGEARSLTLLLELGVGMEDMTVRKN